MRTTFAVGRLSGARNQITTSTIRRSARKATPAVTDARRRPPQPQRKFPPAVIPALQPDFLQVMVH